MISTPLLDDMIGGALERMFEDHFAHAPESLKNEFYAAVSPAVAGDALVHLARVRFEAHRFDFDEGGRWAVVAPIHEGGHLVDFGAFAVADSALRRAYRLGRYAVGFDLALWDANHHPEGRMLVHHDVWSWLRAECEGCLPIDWRRTSIALLEWDVRAIVYPDEMQAREADLRIRRALDAPASFVKRERAAA